MNRKKKQTIESLCMEQAFIQVGANWYRCYGEGLLHVITLQGMLERVCVKPFNREPSVTLGIYSLYDNIFWINTPIFGKRRDLIPRIFPGQLCSNSKNYTFSGTDIELDNLSQYGLPFLEKISTHQDLSMALESLDLLTCGTVLKNDGNKIVPYLISGQFQKVIDTINTIEVQNWDAYEANCSTIPTFDSEAESKKIQLKLAPLISLRNSIESHSKTEIEKYLQQNYGKNTYRLKSMGVQVPMECVSKFEM